LKWIFEKCVESPNLIFNQSNPAHTFSSCFSEIQSNILLKSVLLFLILQPKFCMPFLFCYFLCRNMSCTTHTPWLIVCDFIILIMLGWECKPRSMLCNTVQPPCPPFLSHPNVFFNTWFPNVHSVIPMQCRFTFCIQTITCNYFCVS